jgi:hypothetical protein
MIATGNGFGQENLVATNVDATHAGFDQTFEDLLTCSVVAKDALLRDIETHQFQKL